MKTISVESVVCGRTIAGYVMYIYICPFRVSSNNQQFHIHVFYAICAMGNLFAVCSLATDCNEIDIGPEYMICEQYIAWKPKKILVAHQGAP